MMNDDSAVVEVHSVQSAVSPALTLVLAVTDSELAKLSGLPGTMPRVALDGIAGPGRTKLSFGHLSVCGNKN